MTLPRILVLDDLVGWSPELRRQMCRDLLMRDGSNSQAELPNKQFVGEAFFSSCQRQRGNELENDIGVALDAVASGWDKNASCRWALVLLDLQFNEGRFEGECPDPTRPKAWPSSPDPDFGLQIMRALAKRWPDPATPGTTEIPVVVISSRPRGQREAELNNLGNLGYLEREDLSGTPVSPFQLREQFAHHLFHFGLLEDGSYSSSDGRNIVRVERETEIFGGSLSLLKSLRKARRAATTDLGCLLLGRPGSGKELFARYIHDLSARRRGPFVVVNCPAFPDTLIESELFGYAPRSGIAGADGIGKVGRFEQAHGGTVFLDEIGEMSQLAQAKVLRVLQEKVIQRVSATNELQVDVKIIAATNRNLQSEVSEGRFREDLFQRLEKHVIRIPAIDDRSEDIPKLFDILLERHTKELSGAMFPKRIHPEVYDLLRKRRWKGNVRELDSIAGLIASNRRFSPEIVPTDVPIENHEMVTAASIPSHQTSTITSQPAALLLEEDISIGHVAVAMTKVVIRGTRKELSGSLSELGDAYGRLIGRLLQLALEATREPSNRDDKAPELGDLSPTKAVKLLIGGDRLTTTEAASKILALAKLLPTEMTADQESDLGRTLAWAERRRRPGKSRPDKDA